MKKLIALFLASAVASVVLIGCGSGGGSVDTDAVNKQKEIQNKLNNEQKKNLPPGEGPAG